MGTVVVIDSAAYAAGGFPVDTPDTVLPSTRQPMPVSPDVEALQAIRAEKEQHRSKTADEIEAEIAARTERLTANIDQLVTKVKPANLARSGAEQVRAFVTGPGGAVKKEVIGAGVGALLVTGVLIWLSRRRR